MVVNDADADQGALLPLISGLASSARLCSLRRSLRFCAVRLRSPYTSNAPSPDSGHGRPEHSLDFWRRNPAQVPRHNRLRSSPSGQVAPQLHLPLDSTESARTAIVSPGSRTDVLYRQGTASADDSSSMPSFRLIIRSSTGWSNRDQARVAARARALPMPPARVTELGFELSVNAHTAEDAKLIAESAVQGIHSHTGVYLEAEVGK